MKDLPGGLALPFVIVFLQGLIDAAAGVLFSSQFRTDLMYTFIFNSLFIASLVLPLIAWAGISLAIFLVARMCRGNGSLFATFQLVGYGWLPITISAIVLKLELEFLQRVYPFVSSPSPDTVYLLAIGGVMAGFLVWSWCLWAGGTRIVHGIARYQAVLAVAAAAVVQFLVATRVFQEINTALYAMMGG